MTLSQWSARYRVILRGPASGLWRNETTPHLVEVMDAISSRAYRRVWVMLATQCGKTEILTNAELYGIHHAPCDFFHVLPTERDARDYSKIKLQSSIDACGDLFDGLISFDLERGGKSTDRVRVHNGDRHTLRIIFGGNANALSGWTAEMVALDEVDQLRDNIAGQGDPITIAEARAGNYALPVIICAGTPTRRYNPRTGEGSRMEQGYLSSDQRIYECPCPHCGHYAEWDFHRDVRWPKKKKRDGTTHHITEKARIHCPQCSRPLTEIARAKAIDGGRWRATVSSPDDPEAAGFRLSRLANKFSSVAEIAGQFRATRANPGDYQAFVNTVLGQSWVGQVTEVSIPERIRRGAQSVRTNPNCIYLTLAVDVGTDKLYCLICAHGLGDKTYPIEYREIEGDTARRATWQQLDELRHYRLETKNWSAGVRGVGIDYGWRSTAVAAYYFRPKNVPPRTYQKCFLLKGSSDLNAPIIGELAEAKNRNRRADLIRRRAAVPVEAARKPARYFVGTQQAKDLVCSSLKLPEDEEGSYHFAAGFSARFFSGLTAEQKQEALHSGRRALKWVQIHSFNEPLDLLVYTEATKRLLNFAPSSLQKIYNERTAKSGTISRGAGELASYDPDEAEK